MKKEKSIERYKKIILEIIEKHVPGCKVYLFGSRACKDNDTGSDIDLALDAGHEIDLVLIAKISGEIEETNIPLAVDVVDLYGVCDDFKKIFDKERVVWKS